MRNVVNGEMSRPAGDPASYLFCYARETKSITRERGYAIRYCHGIAADERADRSGPDG